jgi:hypothetical protein
MIRAALVKKKEIEIFRQKLSKQLALNKLENLL